MSTFIVECSRYHGLKDARVMYTVEAYRMAVTTGETREPVLSLLDEHGTVVAIFADWDTAWVEGGTTVERAEPKPEGEKKDEEV